MEKKHTITCECAICNAARKASASKDVPILVGFLALWVAIVILLRAIGF